MTGYYPSAQELKALQQETDRSTALTNPMMQIVPGMLRRTDGFDVDKEIKQLTDLIEVTSDKDYRDHLEALLSRMMSVMDLTPQLYDHFKENPNTLSNWYPQIKAAAEQHGFFQTPDTKVWTLPIEVAQFIRLEYAETDAATRQLFNEMVTKAFDLDETKTYFIKTGTFSSKFEFRNAKCAEPLEMGDYFIVINNYAMKVGAGHSVDLVVREYIEDPEDRPTIYNGMPLRTEFRVFVDFDTDQLIGTVPYWFPSVMRNRLRKKDNATVEQDYYTYLDMEDQLMNDYNAHFSTVNEHIQALLPDVALTGRYSIDVMKNGDDFYIIDMATMESSAMAEFVTGSGLTEY